MTWTEIDPATATPELVRQSFRHLHWKSPGCPKELIFGICDQLDAAQAAIGRVQALLEDEEQPYPGRVLPLGTVSIREVRKALDGGA